MIGSQSFTEPYPYSLSDAPCQDNQKAANYDGDQHKDYCADHFSRLQQQANIIRV